MPVVANINADSRKRRVKTRIAEIAGLEIELLPKPGIHVRDVRLAVFAQIFAVSVDHSGCVVIDARLLFFIDRDDDHHAELLGHFLHQLDGRAVGNSFDRLVPTRLLFGTEIRHREYLLKTKHLHALLSRILNHLHLMIDIRLSDLIYRRIRWCCIVRLYQSTFDYS